jgi:hypothetical protein
METKNYEVNTIKRYSIAEYGDISKVVVDKNSKADFIFYPLTRLKQLRTIKIPYTKWKKMRVCLYKDDLWFPFDRNTLRMRGMVMGLLKTFQLEKTIDGGESKPLYKIAVLVLSTKEAREVYLNMIQNYQLGRFLIYGNVNLFQGTLTIQSIKSLENPNDKKDVQSDIIEMLGNINFGWIEYDDYTYNGYTYRKMMPRKEFNPKKLNDWEELLRHYLYSIGIDKKEVRRLRNFARKAIKKSYTEPYKKSFQEKNKDDFSNDSFSEENHVETYNKSFQKRNYNQVDIKSSHNENEVNYKPYYNQKGIFKKRNTDSGEVYYVENSFGNNSDKDNGKEEIPF